MVLVRLIFAIMLSVIEPVVLHRHFATRAKVNPDSAFRTLHRLHIIPLVLALITILGAVRGSRGLFLG